MINVKKNYTKKFNLKRHKCKNNELHICGGCGIGFKRIDNMKRHRKLHEKQKKIKIKYLYVAKKIYKLLIYRKIDEIYGKNFNVNYENSENNINVSISKIFKKNRFFKFMKYLFILIYNYL